MKHDNQWRPSESRSRSYAPYQRHKLKDVNWVTPEEAASISKRYNHWRNCWGSSIWHKEPNWKLEKDLIIKFLNKPYEEFLKAWHDRTKSLRKQGVPLELNHISDRLTDEPDSRDEFYVDMDGIIRKNQDYPVWKHGKKPIKIIKKEIIKYNLKPEIHNKNWFSTPFFDILFILRRYFSKTDYNEILEGGIPKDKFDRMAENAIYSGLEYTIDKYKHKHNTKLLENNPHAYRGCTNWCNYNGFRDLFDVDYSESVYRYIYPGSPEYARIEAEKQDANRKAIRKYNQQKEEYLSSLLHNIEADRKAREDALNDQKIAKHGFDKDESFRGADYHGQKRKKRKGDWAIEA